MAQVLRDATTAHAGDIKSGGGGLPEHVGGHLLEARPAPPPTDPAARPESRFSATMRSSRATSRVDPLSSPLDGPLSTSRDPYRIRGSSTPGSNAVLLRVSGRGTVRPRRSSQDGPRPRSTVAAHLCFRHLEADLSRPLDLTRHLPRACSGRTRGESTEQRQSNREPSRRHRGVPRSSRSSPPPLARSHAPRTSDQPCYSRSSRWSRRSRTACHNTPSAIRRPTRRPDRCSTSAKARTCRRSSPPSLRALTLRCLRMLPASTTRCATEALHTRHLQMWTLAAKGGLLPEPS